MKKYTKTILAVVTAFICFNNFTLRTYAEYNYFETGPLNNEEVAKVKNDGRFKQLQNIANIKANDVVYAHKACNLDYEDTYKLFDNKISYDEIENLVKVFNANYRQVIDTYANSITNIDMSLSDLELAYENIDAAYKLLPDNSIQKKMLGMSRQGIDKVRAKIQDQKNKLTNSGSQNKFIDDISRQISYALKNLMLNMAILQTQKDNIHSVNELGQASRTLANTSKDIGFGSEYEVNDTELKTDSMIAVEEKIAIGLDYLKKTLLLNLSLYPYKAQDTILELDLKDSINNILSKNINIDEEQINKTLGNRKDIVSLRRSGIGHTSGEIASKKTLENYMSKNDIIKLNDLYLAYKRSIDEYNIANINIQKADADYNLASKGYEIGNISLINKLKATVAYFSAKNEFTSKEVALLKAYNDYLAYINGDIE